MTPSPRERASVTASTALLSLRHPFTIARGTRTSVTTVIVRYVRDGITGLGEASPLARYGESPESALAFIGRTGAALERAPGPSDAFGLDDLLDVVASGGPGDASARAALDTALHDWFARRQGLPIWRMLNLDPGRAPRSSMTIGIDAPGIVERKISEAGAFESLKIKMGVPGDVEFFRLVRGLTDKPLRVDANEGWPTGEEALARIRILEGKGVELIEQPLPAGNHDAVAWLRARTGIPLYADEDVRTAGDLDPAAGVYDGVNVKLMKCGGIREALRIIERAGSLGLKVMIGCMVESSVGIGAAAQISPLAGAADLDGALLVADDPFTGPVGADGAIRLDGTPGIGVRSPGAARPGDAAGQAAADYARGGP